MKERLFSPAQRSVSATLCVSCGAGPPQLTRKRLGLLRRHGSQMPQIALVAHQHDHNVRVGVVPQLLEPSRDILVCLVLADIVDEEGTDRASVVGGRDRTVSFLTGGVPNLRLDGLGFDLDGPRGELDTNGRLGV